MLLNENPSKSQELQNIFKDLMSKYEMGFAVIDLNAEKPEIFGYNLDHFIYPASMYKVFIGAEVLRRIERGDFLLDQKIIVKAPNDVDKDACIFPGDRRKLLNAGDGVSIDYLLDLMLTRSDNSASNCLIDLVGRESITENIIYKHGWQGSEVTRKFLDRLKEEKPYQFSTTTLSCARHFAEFFYLVEKEQLVSSFVSKKLKEYMLQANRKIRKGLWLNEYQEYYCKGGWLDTNLYQHNILSAIKSIIQKRWAIIRWSNEAGVVTLPNGKRYVVVVFSILKTVFPLKNFSLQDFARKIMNYIKKV